MLPRLAAEVDDRIFLHDFKEGARGLAEQLRRLARDVDADRLVVVDVGGDIVATGKESGLLSPLADSLTLAAALSTGLPTSLAVLGPGTDAELSQPDVIQRLDELGAQPVGTVDKSDVKRVSHVLTWHPTEASALVAASALGARGAVEMRRGKHPTPLTETSATIWLVAPNLQDFPLADAIAQTTRLDEARRLLAALAVDEIAYEEEKAARMSTPAPNTQKHISTIAREARLKGATHITTRRLLEQLNLDAPKHDPALRLLAQSRSPSGLWDLRTLSSNGSH